VCRPKIALRLVESHAALAALAHLLVCARRCRAAPGRRGEQRGAVLLVDRGGHALQLSERAVELLLKLQDVCIVRLLCRLARCAGGAGRLFIRRKRLLRKPHAAAVKLGRRLPGGIVTQQRRLRVGELPLLCVHLSAQSTSLSFDATGSLGGQVDPWRAVFASLLQEPQHADAACGPQLVQQGLWDVTLHTLEFGLRRRLREPRGFQLIRVSCNELRFERLRCVRVLVLDPRLRPDQTLQPLDDAQRRLVATRRVRCVVQLRPDSLRNPVESELRKGGRPHRVYRRRHRRPVTALPQRCEVVLFVLLEHGIPRHLLLVGATCDAVLVARHLLCTRLLLVLQLRHLPLQPIQRLVARIHGVACHPHRKRLRRHSDAIAALPRRSRSAQFLLRVRQAAPKSAVFALLREEVHLRGLETRDGGGRLFALFDLPLLPLQCQRRPHKAPLLARHGRRQLLAKQRVHPAHQGGVEYVFSLLKLL